MGKTTIYAPVPSFSSSASDSRKVCRNFAWVGRGVGSPGSREITRLLHRTPLLYSEGVSRGGGIAPGKVHGERHRRASVNIPERFRGIHSPVHFPVNAYLASREVFRGADKRHYLFPPTGEGSFQAPSAAEQPGHGAGNPDPVRHSGIFGGHPAAAGTGGGIADMGTVKYLDIAEASRNAGGGPTTDAIFSTVWVGVPGDWNVVYLGIWREVAIPDDRGDRISWQIVGHRGTPSRDEDPMWGDVENPSTPEKRMRRCWKSNRGIESAAWDARSYLQLRARRHGAAAAKGLGVRAKGQG